MIFSTIGSLLALSLTIAASQPVHVIHLPQKVFTPKGFDDNDHVQVVVSGSFPNACYKVDPTGYQIIEKNLESNPKRIVIRDRNYFLKDQMCIQVPISYSKPIELGLLPAGDYEVVFVGEKQAGRKIQKQIVTKLKVADSPAGNSQWGTDNFPYAITQSVQAMESSIPNTYHLAIRGVVSNTCWKVDAANIKTYFFEGNEEAEGPVIEVLPVLEILDRASDGSDCKDLDRPQRFGPVISQVRTSSKLAEKVLVHVRVLNGRAINEVIDF